MTVEADDDIAQKRVCYNCVGEDYLKAEIFHEGVVAICDYCGDEDVETVTIEELADCVEMAFEDHYEVTSSEPDFFQSMMMKDEESTYEWEREGEPVLDAIANAAEIDEEIAEDVLSTLQERHYDMELAKIGETSLFDADHHYAEKSPNDVELQQDWQNFEAHLKTEARFFSSTAEHVLDRVFGDIANYKTREGTSVVIEAGPKTGIPHLYRARVFQSEEKLKEAMMRPDLHVGPPPFVFAASGRMNAHGISMFYGATTEAVALGEVRPPVGSHVLVASFEILRPVKLLDVAALKTVFVSGSIFDPNHLEQLQRAKFLQRVSDRMTRPVMPDDQNFDYLITQVIADYLSSKAKPELDGIAYPSSQVPGPGINIALLRKSSRVMEMTFPEGTELSADCWESDEDGYHPEFRVIEETPKQSELEESSESKKDQHRDWFDEYEEMLTGKPKYIDYREPVLRVLDSSETVHHVQSVQINTEAHKVKRHRWEKYDFEKGDF
jgi:hypothetical protein